METTKVLEARARAGDADAIFRVGHRLAYGRNRRRPEPWPEIIALWQRALALGQLRAHLHLARLFHRGTGVARNSRKAIHHYTLAAVHGFTDAQWELGWALLEGDGMRRDVHDAVSWFAIGAASGDPDCMMQMGNIYFEGLGRRRDRRQAVWFFRRAAFRGQACAMFRLACCYADGHGVTRSPRWSRYWMQRAADAGDALARRQLRRADRSRAPTAVSPRSARSRP